MSARWLFRIASHARHGGGHVSRAAVLARALKEAGSDVIMQLDPGSAPAAARLSSMGLSCTEDDLPAGGGSESRAWAGSLVDGYDLLAQTAAQLARWAPPLVAIDDFLLPPQGAALVVNSAFGLDGKTIDGVPALLGPRFALVDRAFAQVSQRDRAAPVSHVLVSMGRLDPDNLTARALQAIKAAGAELRVTVALSAGAPFRSDVEAHLAGFGGRGRLLIDADNMPALLNEVDLVIGAGGVSLLERVAAGVPSVTVQLADNQKLFIDGAVAMGVTAAGGTGNVDAMAAALCDLLANPTAREAMASSAHKAVDGEGAARVAAAMRTLAEGAHPPAREAAS